MCIVAVHREISTRTEPGGAVTYKVWFADFSDKTRWTEQNGTVVSLPNEYEAYY